MAKHEAVEKMDASGLLRERYRLLDGTIVSNYRDVPKMKFKEGTVAWAVGMDYVMKTVGMYSTDDPREIKVLEDLETDGAASRDRRVREYPIEDEERLKAKGICVGTLDHGGLVAP